MWISAKQAWSMLNEENGVPMSNENSSTFKIDWLCPPTFVNLFEIDMINAGDRRSSYWQEWKIQLLK